MPKTTESERQRIKQAARAAAERDVQILRPANTRRRRAALKSPQKMMTTYFSDIFFQPFTADRDAMIRAIISAARHSGDFALAGPRGEGKTKLAIFTALWLLLRCELQLPLFIGKNQRGCENELANLKIELTTNELLAADFPELCTPLIALDGWASRARKQTVGGHRTNIGWANDYLAFPTVPKEALPKGWPRNEPSVACGQAIAVAGVDGQIRGFNRRNVRPDLALVDDIDDRESARSATQTADHIDAIEKDIAGLAGSGKRCARVMLCTCIHAGCIADLYTRKPSWQPVRFKAMPREPDRLDLWEEYVNKRCNRAIDDPLARDAHQYYLDNREAMDAGAEVSNPANFLSQAADDGKPLEVSALQHCFNKIADIGREAFDCEYQNSPPELDQSVGSELDRAVIMQKLSGLERCELPPDCTIVIGADVGKYGLHWVALAVRKQAIANVVDYGMHEVAVALGNDSPEVIHQAIVRGLSSFRDELRLHPFEDPDGHPVEVSRVLVDCGYNQDAVVEFVARFGHPFLPAKGIGGGRFRHGQPSDDRTVGSHWFAQRQPDGRFIVFTDVDHWKRDVHDRFACLPLDGKGRPTPGSLSLFIPAGRVDHHSFASHICAEELVTTFAPGKGERQRWVTHSRNNHWLDATALGLAAAEICGKGMFASAVKTAQRPVVISRGVERGSRW